MLTFSREAIASLRTVMQAAPQPVAGVRISPAYMNDARWKNLPLVQLTAISIVDIEEIWLITEDGLLVFVDPALAPFLEETVLCSAGEIGASLSFLMAHDLPVDVPVASTKIKRIYAPPQVPPSPTQV